METPNTRSRVKRGLNDDDPLDEGGTVRWAQDQRLRRMMVEATAGIPIPIPSPTQRPSPRTTHTPKYSSSTSATGSSTRPPARKRPCRAHRSLPSQLSTLATPDHDPYVNRSSSVPTQPKGDGGVLDDLLDRAFRTFSVQTPTTVAAAKCGIGGIERQVSSGSSSSGGPTPLIRDAPATTRSTLDAEKQRLPPRRVLAEQPLNDPPKHIRSSDISSPSKSITSTKQTQQPYPRQANVPRVGLSSNTKPSVQPAATNPSVSMRNTAPAHSHRFRPPFIQQPIRCSPRRPPPAAAVHPPAKATYETPTRPPRAPPLRPAPSRTPSRNNTAAVQAHDSLIVPVLVKEAKEAPSSDSVGDESFDSFDGMFQAGGDDVEALLRQVDGGGGR